MGRGHERYLEERRQRVLMLQDALAKLDSVQCAYLIRWLVKHFNDDGLAARLPGREQRRRMTLDGEEYWLVRIPPKQPQVNFAGEPI